MSRVRIIGIGSPFGDDRIGWECIDHLVETGFAGRFPPGTVSVEKADRPGGLLIALVRDAELAILVDAMQSGRAAGTVCRFQPGDLSPGSGPLSGHALGVADTLALGQALRELPRQVVVYGIEMDGRIELSMEPSPAITNGCVLAELRRRIADDVGKVICEPAGLAVASPE